MTSAEWLRQSQYAGIVVMDPDGWDRKDFERSWGEEITEEEFFARLLQSTCLFNQTAVRYGRNQGTT